MVLLEGPREAAARAGLTRYSTGKPCVNGHASERYVANTSCVACHAAAALKYLPKRAVVHAARIEAIRAEKRAYKARNRERCAANRAARRARELQAVPPWLTKADRDAIVALYKRAAWLTKITGINHHVDHIYPLAGKLCCGLHVPWNLQILTRDANWRKGAQMPVEAVGSAMLCTPDEPPRPFDRTDSFPRRHSHAGTLDARATTTTLGEPYYQS